MTPPDDYDEEREDYASLADEMNDGDEWVETDWDPRAVESARRYAKRKGLRFPPQIGDYDRFYEARDAESSHKGRCLDCGDEWTERNEIAICPECHSRNVVEVSP